MDDVMNIPPACSAAPWATRSGPRSSSGTVSRSGRAFRGPEELPSHDGRAGRITDVTQMTLFTAEGLIRAVVRAQARGNCPPEDAVHHALLRWCRT